MKPLSIALAAALLVTGGTSAAQSASDARCIVLATGFANQSKDANQQKIAEDTLYFYLGRVGGQPSLAGFKAMLDAQAKTITDATADALMAQCVSAVKSKVVLLQSLGTPPRKAANPEGR
jgi:putative SOS response-associated peptidase YedK